jgi:hypothetical protein
MLRERNGADKFVVHEPLNSVEMDGSDRLTRRRRPGSCYKVIELANLTEYANQVRLSLKVGSKGSQAGALAKLMFG